MRIRHPLPIADLLALAACRDEKKAEDAAPSPPPASTAPANPTPPATAADPAPADRP